MPGHKGKDNGFLESYDITEINGADVLYNPNGIILQSENNATSLFNSLHTFYSTEGSTLCIKAMLYLATQGIENPTIIANRNVHVAFINACALLNIKVVWLYGKSDNFYTLQTDLQELEIAILNNKNVCGVYITSPDYLGGIAPISQISKICKNHNIALLVDNAHASYSAFLKDNFHPNFLGADMVCDSSHKTLTSLTGGAYLHINNPLFLDNARKALSLFASTSPSYLILQSLDYTNLFIEKNKDKFDILVDSINNLKIDLINKGYLVQSGEPLKLTINYTEYGYTQQEFYNYLQNYKIEPEMISGGYCVFMLSVLNSKKDLKVLKKALTLLPKKQAIKVKPINFYTPTKVLSIRQATLKNSREIEIDKAEGSICAKSVITCPPALPIVICGELITKQVITLLKQFNIEKIFVIKN